MTAYIKLGFLEFIRNLKMNFLIVLEMAVLISVSVFTVSTLMSQLKYYLPLSDYLSEKGFYLWAENIASHLDQGDYLETVSDIKSKSDKIEKVCAFSRFNGSLIGKKYDVNTSGIAYNTDLINLYKPLMQEGKWLSEVPQSKDVLNIVVSENNSGINVGDEYEILLDNGESNKTVKAKVVGKTVDGAKIFYRAGSDMNSYTAEDFYKSIYFNPQLSESAYIIADQNQLDEFGVRTYLSKTAFIKLYDSTSDSEVSDIKSIFRKSGGITEGQKVKENSLKDVKTNLIYLLPIIAGTLIFTVVTAVCMSAINAKNQLRNYGIYYVCGSRWKQCSLISLFSSLITSALAVMLAAAGMFVCKRLGVFSQTVIDFGFWQFVACAVTVLISVGFSVLMPIIIIGKTQPREIIKSNE